MPRDGLYAAGARTHWTPTKEVIGRAESGTETEKTFGTGFRAASQGLMFFNKQEARIVKIEK